MEKLESRCRAKKKISKKVKINQTEQKDLGKIDGTKKWNERGDDGNITKQCERS